MDARGHTPPHLPTLMKLLGDEDWFGDTLRRLAGGSEKGSFFERQLLSPDFGPRLARWLQWASERGGHQRFVEKLRDENTRADRPRGSQYVWRQVFDELQVGFLVGSESNVSVQSTCEPPGRKRKRLDWSGLDAGGAPVFFEVSSLFTGPFDGVTGTEPHRVDWTPYLDGGFQHAVEKFEKTARNVLVTVAHEPWPDAGDVLRFLYGPDGAVITADLRGSILSITPGFDKTSRQEIDNPQIRKMYSHFNPRENTRVGAVILLHSRPDGDTRIVVFHNPWARKSCAVPLDLFSPWCQVSASVTATSIRFFVTGEMPRDMGLNDMI